MKKIKFILFSLLFPLILNGQNEMELRFIEIYNEFRKNPKIILEVAEKEYNKRKFMASFKMAKNIKIYVQNDDTIRIDTIDAMKDFMNYEQEYKKFIDFINNLKPMPEVEFNEKMYNVTKLQGEYISSKKIFSHKDKNGKSPYERFKKLNLTTVSECLYQNYSGNLNEETLYVGLYALLMDFNIDDKTHRKILTDPNVSQISTFFDGKTLIINLGK
jgi:hypothetical protein